MATKKTKTLIKANKAKAEDAFGCFLTALGFDFQNDPNMDETPKRVSKMYIEEIFSGVYTEQPKITVFPNTENYDELIISSWDFSSTCSHHALPFLGKVIIGILPGDKLLGLSKYGRIVEWFAHRPQLQENLTQQIGNHLMGLIKPKGLGVYVKAHHMCASIRGVKQHNAEMITTAMYGLMKENHSLKQEFMTSWK